MIGLVGSENHKKVVKVAPKDNNCLDATLDAGDVWSIEFCNTYKMF